MEIELPSQDSSVFTLNEGASSQGNQDCWSHLLEAKLVEMVWLAFQNIDWFIVHQGDWRSETHLAKAMDPPE